MLFVLHTGAAALVTHGPRRAFLRDAAALSIVPLLPCEASDAQLAASWKATDGFSEASFISFDEKAYEAMRDDEGRTPLFEKAIRARLAGQEGKLTVLEIGTGPFALLALIAARQSLRPPGRPSLAV